MLALEAATPTEPADLDVRRPLASGDRSDGQRRIDVAAGTTGGDQDPHRSRLPRDWVSREIERRIPTAAKLTTQRRAAGAHERAA